MIRILLGAVLLGLLAISGCSGSAPVDQPPAVDEEALRREAEERAQREEEARQLAEQRRIEEEKRQLAEMQELFGPVGEPPSLAPPPAPPVSDEVPFDEAVPPLPADPTVRVAVFSLDTQPDKGRQVALILGTHERERLEERLGMAVKIAYVSHVKGPPAVPSEIRYRPNFLRAAQGVAGVLSAEQRIGPMTADDLRQEVDVVVVVGPTYN